MKKIISFQHIGLYISLICLISISFRVNAQVVPLHKWALKIPDRPNCVAGEVAPRTHSDDAGNVYILGAFCQPFDADPGSGVFTLTADNSTYSDAYLIKLDATGKFAWARRFGIEPFRHFPSSISVDASGNVFTLIRYEVGFANFRTILSKYDVSGNSLWNKTIYTVGAGRSMLLDGSENLLITGDFRGTVDFDPGAAVYPMTSSGSASDLFVLKLDNNGNFLWVKTAGGTGDEIPLSIAKDGAGNIIVGGLYHGTNPADFDPGAGVFNLTAVGQSDAFILKLDVNGNFVWAKSMGGVQTDYLQALAVNTSGNIFATGYFSDTADFNPDAGIANLISASLASDIFLMRLNADGSFAWASRFGGNDADEGRAITTDTNGNLIFTGTFNKTVDFDPGVGVRNLVSTGQSNGYYQSVFIVKLNENQDLIWAQEITGGDISRITSSTISIDNAGEISIGGVFDGGADFDFGICNNPLDDNVPVTFVMKITEGTTGPPTITSFSPASGIAGTTVVITGTNFSLIPSENEVRWSPSRLAVVTASTPTTITAIVPANASCSGKLYVKVKCYPTVISTDNFTVVTPLPTITSFNPPSGNVGTTITIIGTNFSATPANNSVRFNGTTAIVTASTATSITTTVPSGATTGTVAVTADCSTVNSPSNFTVTSPLLPTISSFTPNFGPVSTSLTLTGTNFSATPANNIVKFNGSTSVVSASTATSITTTVPAGATTGKITVTVAGNTATSATNFTVTTPALPTITSFTPASGPIGTTVTTTGTNFSTTPANNTVKFNGTTAIVTASTVTSITTTVPAGATTGTITVAVAGNTATSATNFTVTTPALPTITSFTPAAGSIGTTVTITGTNFSTTPANNTLQFNGITASVTASTATSITTLVPSGATTGKITVTVAGNNATSASDFIVNVVTANQPPVIASSSSAAPINGIVTIDLLPLLSDPDDNLDLSTLSLNNNLSEQGAAASITQSFELVLDYGSVAFAGTDRISLSVCDLAGECDQQNLSIEVQGDVSIYNAISPNGDDLNKIFYIEYIDSLPETQKNKVTIYNRWGSQVFEVKDYNNTTKVFSGLNNSGNELPSGTYYYKIEFNNGKPNKTGYLALQR